MKKFVIIAVIVALLIAGGVAGFLLIQKSKKIIQPTEKNNVASSTEKTEVIDIFLHDQDKDGLLDEKEKALGTSDKAFDTDKDSISDYSEINLWKTDPTKKDTDGDGFGDGIEVIKGFNPLGPGKLTK